MPVTLLARWALVLLALVAPAAAATETPPVDVSAVFLVRHAEKIPDGSRDPGLTEEGRARARQLANLLEVAGVTHLFSSEYLRARATLEPLAERTGLPIEVVPAGDPEDQVARVRGLPPGSVSVVSGHSNTIPALVRALGGDVSGTVQDEKYGERLGEEEHDRLFLVLLPVGDGEAVVRTLELRYGAPAARRP